MMEHANPFEGQAVRPASAALPPVSVVFGSMGSSLMAVGTLDEAVFLDRVRNIAAQLHENAAHIGCVPGNHDFTTANIISGQEAVFGRAEYATLVYCRKCPYHYFPTEIE